MDDFSMVFVAARWASGRPMRMRPRTLLAFVVPANRPAVWGSIVEKNPTASTKESVIAMDAISTAIDWGIQATSDPVRFLHRAPMLHLTWHGCTEIFLLPSLPYQAKQWTPRERSPS